MYKVSVESKPGFYTQYKTIISVFAECDETAKNKALRKLKTGAFPDRSNSMWTVTKIEKAK